MKFEKTKVMGFEGAFRGMRNPKNSWNRSDSMFERLIPKKEIEKYAKAYSINAIADTSVNDVVSFSGIGANDLKLAQQLIGAGPEHCKFLRQIFVSVDITAPLYWWKEFDTYKVGTTANSTSTMHKVMSKPITRESFETDDLNEDLVLFEVPNENGAVRGGAYLDMLAEDMENMRQQYLKYVEYEQEEIAQAVWKELIRNLPESWLQTRTVTLSYANLRNIYFQREFHKLTEWRKSFCNWVKTLPFAAELITYKKPHVCKCNKSKKIGYNDIIAALAEYNIILTPEQMKKLPHDKTEKTDTLVDMSRAVKVYVGAISDGKAGFDSLEARASFNTYQDAWKYLCDKADSVGHEYIIYAVSKSKTDAIIKFLFNDIKNGNMAYKIVCDNAMDFLGEQF